MNTLPISERALIKLNSTENQRRIIKEFGEPANIYKRNNETVLQYADYRWSMVYIHLDSQGNFKKYEVDW